MIFIDFLSAHCRLRDRIAGVSFQAVGFSFDSL